VFQSGQKPRLALQTRQTFGIGSNIFRQCFDGNFPAQLRVHGPPHVAHTTRAQVSDELIMGQLSANHGDVKFETIV
jgi:hypothetical protein